MGKVNWTDFASCLQTQWNNLIQIKSLENPDGNMFDVILEGVWPSEVCASNVQKDLIKINLNNVKHQHQNWLIYCALVET